MTDPSFLTATRASYDAVAGPYAELARDELTGKPLDRAVLGMFAELRIRAEATRPADPTERTPHAHLLAQKPGETS